MDSIPIAKSARQSERLRCLGGYPRPIGIRLMRIYALSLICWCAVLPSPYVSAKPYPHSGQTSSENSGPDFIIRLRNGQTEFHQGEIITMELGYGADPEVPAKRFADHPDHPGLAVDRFVLSPHTGVVDPLRDFMSTVGGWSGPPPRSFPFVEAGGAWAIADINEWFRFDKPGKYSLTVLTHPVRTRSEAFGSRPAGAETLKSNTVEFEIVPADEPWQATTLQKALAHLESESNWERQREGCRILRFLATPEAVDKMVEHYAGQPMCESEYRYGLFAYPDRQYAERQMENGLLGPSVAVSAGYLDTLARLSACLQHPDSSSREDEQYLGASVWAMGGSVDLGASVEEEQNRYAEELLGAIENKLDAPRALCLKALFDSPYLGRPTLLKSNDPALLAKLRKELAAVFTDLPIWDQQMLLYDRWENIASPAMVPVLKRLYENPPAGSNEQFISFVLNDLFRTDPAEGRALILAEMRRPHPRLDLRFTRLLPNQEIPELDGPLAENLEDGDGDEDTILQLIGRYATPAIFPRVLAVEESRVARLPCEGQAAFLTYAFRSDPIRGTALLEECLGAHDGCSAMALSQVASRHMTLEIEHLAIEHLGDSDPQVAASAAATLGSYGSAEAEQPLWDRLERWHARWAGRASELPNGSGPVLQNGLETALEQALINALGAGQAWFAGPRELVRLSKLCVSTGGCQKVKEITTESEAAPNINVYGFAPDYRGSVAQYQADSLDSLKQKLVQFPQGTIFTWSFGGDEEAAVLAGLRAFLKGHGMTIR